MNQKLNIKYLNECLDYNPETGTFVWKARPTHHFKNIHGQRIFNSKFSGKKAGSPNGKGYLRINICGKLHVSHRLAWVMVNNDYPASDIDHINGIRDDNRISNLREASRSENLMNSKLKSNNTSGIKGVYWNTRIQKWCAEIKINKVRHHLGYFITIEEASACVHGAREIHHGAFANHGTVLA